MTRRWIPGKDGKQRAAENGDGIVLLAGDITAAGWS
jgi:hypothetical protein